MYRCLVRIFLFLNLGTVIFGCVQGVRETRTQVISEATPTVQEIQAIPHTGPQIRVAVTRFENKAGPQGQVDIGTGMAEQLVGALVRTGKFIVLERLGLDDVIREQDISMTGRMNLETAPELAKLEGAEFLILGAITGFTPNLKGGGASIAKDGAIGVGGGGNVLGGNVGISGNYQEAYVSIDLRVVDTTTGRVVNATTVEGTPSSAGAGIGVFFGGVALGIQGFYNTPVGQAVRACIEKAVEWIASNAFADRAGFAIRNSGLSKHLPRVVQVMPTDGAMDVPVSLKEIVIVFDKRMHPSWNIGCSPDFFPDAPVGKRCSAAGISWQDAKTFVLPLSTGLKPNRYYSLTINPRVGTAKFSLPESFRGLGQSEPVPPQHIVFRTGP